MNYFAHGRQCLDDPYLLAGTAIPDWLNVVDRRIRVRSRHAAPFASDPDPLHRSLAAGVLKHHRDDGWFHESRAFVELSLDLTARIRQLGVDDGFRPSFLGHILVEMLFDAWLIAADPGALRRYYQALSALDRLHVERFVNQAAGSATDRLATWIPRFVEAGFLWDYAHDGKLCWRLTQVLTRVGLPGLPAGLEHILPELRRSVADRALELLSEKRDEIRHEPALVERSPVGGAPAGIGPA